MNLGDLLRAETIKATTMSLDQQRKVILDFLRPRLLPFAKEGHREVTLDVRDLALAVKISNRELIPLIQSTLAGEGIKMEPVDCVGNLMIRFLWFFEDKR